MRPRGAPAVRHLRLQGCCSTIPYLRSLHRVLARISFAWARPGAAKGQPRPYRPSLLSVPCVHQGSRVRQAGALARSPTSAEGRASNPSLPSSAMYARTQ